MSNTFCMNKNLRAVISFILATSTSITSYHCIIHSVSKMYRKIPFELEDLRFEDRHKLFGYFIVDA